MNTEDENCKKVVFTSTQNTSVTRQFESPFCHGTNKGTVEISISSADIYSAQETEIMGAFHHLGGKIVRLLGDENLMHD